MFSCVEKKAMIFAITEECAPFDKKSEGNHSDANQFEVNVNMTALKRKGLPM